MDDDLMGKNKKTKTNQKRAWMLIDVDCATPPEALRFRATPLAPKVRATERSLEPPVPRAHPTVLFCANPAQLRLRVELHLAAVGIVVAQDGHAAWGEASKPEVPVCERTRGHP